MINQDFSHSQIPHLYPIPTGTNTSPLNKINFLLVPPYTLFNHFQYIMY